MSTQHSCQTLNSPQVLQTQYLQSVYSQMFVFSKCTDECIYQLITLTNAIESTSLLQRNVSHARESFESLLPTVADFYHCFTSETGCCLSLTALNENQLQNSCAVCVCVSHQVFFCGINLTPIPYHQTAQHFLLSPPFLLIMFCLLPLKQPSSPSLSTLPQTHSDRAAIYVPASHRCVYHPSFRLYSLSERACFVWRGKRKQ